MFEAEKAISNYLFDIRFVGKYFVGKGIDIGAGNDGLIKYKTLFPLLAVIIKIK